MAGLESWPRTQPGDAEAQSISNPHPEESVPGMRNTAALGIVVNSLHTRIKMFFFLKTGFHPMDHS